MLGATTLLALACTPMDPGTTPATSRPEIEMPARLPSSTVIADGGTSMSTPPIAMIGPMPIFGS